MFLSLQKAVDSVLMDDILKASDQRPQLFLQRFPYPEHQKNSFYNVAPTLIPITFLFGFMLTILYTARSIATYQERGIRVKAVFIFWNLCAHGLFPFVGLSLCFWTQSAVILALFLSSELSETTDSSSGSVWSYS